MHSSEIDGSATITISGTTYAANADASGTGYLIGAGMDFDAGGYTSRAGYTYYANMGGENTADVGFLYFGFRFSLLIITSFGINILVLLLFKISWIILFFLRDTFFAFR